MSASLHTEALSWLRYGKRMPVVCTEVGPWNADVLGISDRMAIEVEVKKSKSDLLADFRNKKAKHFLYANADKDSRNLYVPNYLYYFVPEALGEYALKTVTEKCPKAGVAILMETSLMAGHNTTIIKKPTQLRAGSPSQRFIRTAIMRMSSELCGRYLSLDRAMEQAQKSLDDIRNVAINAAARASGGLDVEDREADLQARAAELVLAVEQVEFKTLTKDEQQKWIQAAQRWLEAQYINSEDWQNAKIGL